MLHPSSYEQRNLLIKTPRVFCAVTAQASRLQTAVIYTSGSYRHTQERSKHEVCTVVTLGRFHLGHWVAFSHVVVRRCRICIEISDVRNRVSKNCTRLSVFVQCISTSKLPATGSNSCELIHGLHLMDNEQSHRQHFRGFW